MASTVTASGWLKGISLSILASLIGGASKLAIRKSWLIESEQREQGADEANEESSGYSQISDYEASAPEEGSNNETLQRLSSHGSISHPTGGSAELQLTAVEEALSLHAARKRRGKIIAYALRFGGMIGMTFLNPTCSVLAMNYASPSILAPFSGLTLVWIVLLSQPLNHERPTARQVVAVGLIIFGELLVAAFGDHTNDQNKTIADVTHSYQQLPFLIYLAVTTLWILVLMVWMKYPSHPMLQRFAWGVAGGSLTGFQNFLKDFLTILKVKGPDEDYPWYTPLLLFLAVASAFIGLCFLTACMKRYDATYSGSMFVGSFVVSASIMSAVHYATFVHLQGLLNIILYPSGLIVLMGGVGVLICERGAIVESQSIHVSEHSSVAPRVELVCVCVPSVCRRGSSRKADSRTQSFFFCVAGTSRERRNASGLSEETPSRVTMAGSRSVGDSSCWGGEGGDTTASDSLFLGSLSSVATALSSIFLTGSSCLSGTLLTRSDSSFSSS
jgi:drug/metabolite transporter (DMT)-like permease